MTPTPTPMTFEEFVYQTEWFEIMRLSQFVSEYETLKLVKAKVREHRRGRPLFKGPFGEKSEWAGLCRGWYRHYLEANK